MRLILLLTSIFIFANGLWAQSAFPMEKQYYDARQLAKSEGKNTVVFIYTDNSKQCAYVSDVCLKDNAVINTLKKSYISTMVNATSFEGKSFTKKWKISKSPAVVILDPSGNKIASVNQGLAAPKLTEFLQYYSQKENLQNPITFTDNDFGAKVNQWTDYKGQDTYIAEDMPVHEMPSETVAERSKPTQPETKITIEKKPEPVPVKAQPATTQKSAPSGNFIVQAGVFGTETNAKLLCDKINAISGQKATVEDISTGDKTLYRVVAGRFESETDAREVINTLASASIKGIVKSAN